MERHYLMQYDFQQCELEFFKQEKNFAKRIYRDRSSNTCKFKTALPS